MGSQTACRAREGPMIKLSDVKVRPQYRTWVRYRLTVLEYAGAHGATAAGLHYRISARTIRRLRPQAEWRRRRLGGLLPAASAAPGAVHRPGADQAGSPGPRLRGRPDTLVAAAGSMGIRLAMGTIQRVSGPRPAPAATHAQAAA